jgi:hypothetical protein
MSRKNRRPGPAKLQCNDPAFIKAKAKVASIGVDPKYLHSAERRRVGISSARWKVLEDEWKREWRTIKAIMAAAADKTIEETTGNS